MITRKIRGIQTFEATERGRIFSGMDVQAEYADDKGRFVELKFHYQYFTDDLRGQVERVLSYLQSGKPMPAEYTKVEV
jgi:hypothetical protein